MNKKYIAKPNTWFDEGTEATLICEITSEYGLFSGIKDGKEDEEGCLYEEFDIWGIGAGGEAQLFAKQ